MGVCTYCYNIILDRTSFSQRPMRELCFKTVDSFLTTSMSIEAQNRDVYCLNCPSLSLRSGNNALDITKMQILVLKVTDHKEVQTNVK